MKPGHRVPIDSNAFSSIPLNAAMDNYDSGTEHDTALMLFQSVLLPVDAQGQMERDTPPPLIIKRNITGPLRERTLKACYHVKNKSKWDQSGMQFY